MTVEAVLLMLTWSMPLVLGVVQLFYARRIAPLALIAALPALLTAVFVPVGATVEVPSMLLGTKFALDATGQAFLLFTALLWGFAIVFAALYLREDAGRPRFFAFFLLAMSGNLGLIVAADMLAFYLFFALMSFASYGLIIHTRRDDALYAGRVYMILVVLGEVLLFAALVLIAASSGTVLFSELAARAIPDIAALLIFISFGIKVGVVLLHPWLPLAHPAAPIPASAVLSGAMLKAGVLGWLRFLHPAESAPEWGSALIIIGLLTAFYGVLVGISQTNPKTVLAYSSISQMGFLIIGVGAWLISTDAGAALAAVWLYAIHHALAKGALFIGVAFAGISRIVPLLLLIPALSLAGLPLTSGATAKTALKNGISALPLDWNAALTLPLSLAAMGTTLLMARFLWLMWHSPRPEKPQPALAWGVWIGLLGLVLGLTFALPYAADSIAYSLTPSSAWNALWPVLAGVILAALTAIIMSRAHFKGLPLVPPGDVVGLFTWLWRSARRGAVWLAEQAARVNTAIRQGFRPVRQVLSVGAVASQMEHRLRTDWLTAGSTLLILALGILFLAWNAL